MGKAPAFQFYPGDWIQDTRPLSLAAKGAWIDLLCAMWRSQTRGELSLPLIGYARLIGATADQAKATIDELIAMQICDSVTPGNGNITISSRRMKREEKERISTRSRVQKYRNAMEKRSSNANVTPPSSSSSSISLKKNKYSFVRTSIEYGLSELLFQKIRERKPDFKTPNLDKWSWYVSMMIRRDGRDPTTIRKVIEWCQQDDFWQNNILSTEKMRKQFDQLEMKMNSQYESKYI